MLNSSTLRRIWLIVEQTQTRILLEQTRILLELSDSELVSRIQTQLETQVFLTASELNAAHHYIQSKVTLIRDLAECRLARA
ncbi:MAG: hypothetical protein ACRC2S_11425 [Waterburya sp.]